MSLSALSTDKPNPAETILEAAINRFSEYGYNKSTMAEIAEDADMSAANIYRYFKNKEEIAAACAKKFMHERIEGLKAVVRNTKLSAIEKLEQYVLTTLQITQNNATENKRIDEVCAEITRNRTDLVHEKINNEKALLMEILSYGNQTGEFNVDDVVDTAAAIHAMLIVFDVPMFMHLFSKDEFENKARSVIRVMVSGLKSEN